MRRNHFVQHLVQSSRQLLFMQHVGFSLQKYLDHFLDLALATAARQTPTLAQPNSNIVQNLNSVVVNVKRMPTYVLLEIVAICFG